MSAPLPTQSPLIDAHQLARALAEDPALVVLDATVDLPSPRFDGDYRVASGHPGWLAARIPGARHADLVTALARPDPVCSFTHPDGPALALALQTLGVGAGTRVVTYDKADGFWAARLWWMLRDIGVDVRVLDGGWRAWTDGGHPVESGPAAAIQTATRPVTPRPSAPRWADIERVRRISTGTDASGGVLVNALPEAAFRGQTPTRYSRRGHIPGSRNLPARALMDATGRLKDRAALAQVVAQALPGLLERKAAGPVVAYCGGGISAAYLALGLSALGLDDVLIYDGSLQEWSARADLPLICIDHP